MQEIEKPGFELLAKRLEIRDQEQYEAAGNLLREVKAFQKMVESDQRPIVDAAHKTWKTALAKLQAHLEPAKAAEDIIKNKMESYVIEKERTAAIERARLLAEAEAKARAEREAAVQRAMADAAAAAEERDELTAVMAMDEAAAIEAAPVVPTVDLRAVATPKSRGTSASDYYDFEIVSLAALPDEYKIADEKKLRRVINAHRGQIIIAGVKVIQRKRIAQRA